MAILNSINYPRILAKLIDYDADGNQLEIREQINDPAEPEGFREVSLKKHLWDAEDRLRAADLSPENDEDKPLVAVYTYDAGGERSIKYVPGRFDARYSAKEAGKADRLESMLYPSPLLSAKTLPVPENMGDKKDPKLISYTKHYYIGTERIASVIGSKRGLGAYCFSADPSVPLEAMEIKVDAAGAAVQEAFAHFEKTITLLPPFLFSSDRYHCSDVQVPEDYSAFWYHPDHLGSSSYITNLAGEITQHMEYLPFGETLIEEHLNSNNSPYKFNAKELDAETGNYYYGARYYDPKFSIWLSVDPASEMYPSFSPYAYTLQNPVRYVDPTGMVVEDNPVYDSNGNYRGDTQEGFTGEAIIYDGDKDFSNMSKDELVDNNGGKYYGEARKGLGKDAQSKVLTNILDCFELPDGTVLDSNENFDISIGKDRVDANASYHETKNGKHQIEDNGFYYEYTVENIRATF